MALIPGLVRPQQGRIVAGVCAGIARKLDVDVTLVRVVVFLAIFPGALSVWAYPLAWALMPDEGSEKAPIEDLVKQAKDWNADRKLSQPTQPQARQDDLPTFNPYQEPKN